MNVMPNINQQKQLNEVNTDGSYFKNFIGKDFSELSKQEEKEVGDFFTRMQSELKESFEKIKEKINEFDVKKLDAKAVGLSVLGAALAGALAYFTFNFALVPISFLIQLLFSGGVAVNISEQVVQILQSILALGVIGTQYGSAIAGAVAGGQTTYQMLQKEDPTKVEELKMSFEKLKNSESFMEYIRNGFNLGVEWGKESNKKAGNWANVPLALAVSSVMMAPLALLITSLSLGTVGLVPAIGLGLLASLPIGVKVFNAVKGFAKEIYGLIGGVIGGAVGASLGVVSKVFNTVKSWFSKSKSEKETDEFQKNTPYKNSGVEKIMESTGKTTENFIKGSADVLSFTALINNILTKQPNGLGSIASIVGGTIKSLEGASILKNSAVDNKPQNFKVGLFRFLSGFSMLLSFLGPLFGPLGVVGFSVASLLFMGLEKLFAAKNKISENENKDSENTLKNSYAIGTAGGDFVNGLGSLGKFWMGWSTIFGGGYGGLTSIFGLIGSTRDIIQGAKMMQMADERNNLGIGIQGLLNIVGGVSLALAALGLGRLFGAVSIGIEIAKLVFQIYSMVGTENFKERVAEKLGDIKNRIIEKFNNLFKNDEKQLQASTT
ncbi:MAG: hypothetical protein NZM44_00180 [Candidatus Calescibacterium sp.]|nr:hypothetical protein [Candidatus Calescibacterium sp.]